MNETRQERERREAHEEHIAGWVPKTSVGKLVKNGEITSLEQLYDKNLAVLEPEIIDFLVPNLKEEVLGIKNVQRVTDSGRRASFMITVAIGNKDGCIGVGIGKGVEIAPTIERAIRAAKKNIISIKRGCGSWECACSNPHSIPFKIRGKHGSVKIQLLPAPKGTGVVAGKTAKKVIALSGIKDVWSMTRGNTGTVLNFAMATYNALRAARKTKFSEATE